MFTFQSSLFQAALFSFIVEKTSQRRFEIAKPKHCPTNPAVSYGSFQQNIMETCQKIALWGLKYIFHTHYVLWVWPLNCIQTAGTDILKNSQLVIKYMLYSKCGAFSLLQPQPLIKHCLLPCPNCLVQSYRPKLSQLLRQRYVSFVNLTHFSF